MEIDRFGDEGVVGSPRKIYILLNQASGKNPASKADIGLIGLAVVGQILG